MASLDIAADLAESPGFVQYDGFPAVQYIMSKMIASEIGITESSICSAFLQIAMDQAFFVGSLVDHHARVFPTRVFDVGEY